MNQTLFQFFWEELPVLLNKLNEQIYLVGISTIAAVTVGVPVGIWIFKRKRLCAFVLGLAGMLQTIPSLALLAFLLPFLGIGVMPALLALLLYALLPIIRNTVIGLQGVSPELQEAAQGLGFTVWQKLSLVDFPLALPTIIGGIRTATTINVGVATLAAFIGAGGLGDFINQGLALNNNRLVLLGAIPAAILALVFDFCIGRFELLLSERSYKKVLKSRFYFMIALGVVIAIAVGFGAKSFFNRTVVDQGTVRVATKNFTEQYILGELLAQMIETKTHLHVKRVFNLGTTAVCHKALLKGNIDLYPEYTGTAYVTILKKQALKTSDQVYNIVKYDYLKQFNIVWLPPFGFNNTQAIMVRQDFSHRYHLKTIGDLKQIEEQLIIGVPAECIDRADCFPGLAKVYDLHFGNIKQMDPGLTYEALYNRRVNTIMGFSTDGRIPIYHLVVLQDNKHLFLPYYAAPVVRLAVLRLHPELKRALQPLAHLIDDGTMQALNYQVDIQKRSPADVARAFLKSKGLL